MAGHSKFKNIMYRKGAQDKKRGKIFARLGREITVAVKIGGPDSGANPRLRAALNSAKAENMPKDNVERAIKKGSGEGNDSQYEEIRYEGYGPSGIAIMVETMTDNRNRTASQIRTLFNKNDGSLGETGSVSYMFERIGEIVFTDEVDFEKLFEVALNNNAEDVSETEEQIYRVTCKPENLHVLADALTKELEKEPLSISSIWHPQNFISVGGNKAISALRLINALDNHDDVQQVCSNFDISEDDMEKLDL